MTKIVKVFLLLLVTAKLSYSQSVFPRQLNDSIWAVTETQILNANLCADSLDECKEVTDSLQSQINNALNVIQADSALIDNLRLMSLNQVEIIKDKDLLLLQEKHISSSYRNKYRLWKILSIVFAGLTVYQSVK